MVQQSGMFLPILQREFVRKRHLRRRRRRPPRAPPPTAKPHRPFTKAAAADRGDGAGRGSGGHCSVVDSPLGR